MFTLYQLSTGSHSYYNQYIAKIIKIILFSNNFRIRPTYCYKLRIKHFCFGILIILFELLTYINLKKKNNVNINRALL